MLQPRTVPGVYVQELNAFPNSVVEVATSLPVFIGYTQQASFQGRSLAQQVIEINSLSDYVSFFGGAPSIQYTLAEWKQSPTTPVADIPLNGKSYTIAPVASSVFYLYNSIRLFYQNGGGTAYIVSVGNYSAAPQMSDFSSSSFDVFDLLKTVQEPTMILAPDVLLLGASNYYTFMNNALQHCSDVKSRIAMMDVVGGDISSVLSYKASIGSPNDVILNFRNGINSAFVSYGVSYFPWLNTNIVQSNEINFNNISGGVTPYLEPNDANVQAIAKKITPTMSATDVTSVHNALLGASPNYVALMKLVSTKINCLPATPAMAGVYTSVDASRGVWKAPANVGVNAVVSPTMSLDDDLQSSLNVDAVTGKSINAIRAFKGMGTLVWGARTLDGNSGDWRYVNVRRTMIMIEQSVKLAAQAYVFEPNDANTWISLKSTIENFLTNLWKQGALAGSKPADAFSVSVGLGSTMTAQDILDGYLDIVVLVAISHPAEFIEIAFQQQLQKS